MRLWLLTASLWGVLVLPMFAQARTPITDQFKIPPFRDYTGDGVQNLDDIPAHQKNYNEQLRQWAGRISGTR
ncbi:MAG: hypothetical protein NZL92_02445 [Gloeomargarita sp. SKYG116]|nr:hypothetical protein [Gloeomargarita sp. SKYG116]MCS7225495.1 hypothetical protein [Gloeomargarita sp. SKYB31]MDW8400537.1 hypothetical protein [Gloeomargarita sp. SKYGB_i_bin116]